jgi:uncharacterized protein (DUF697 family)
LNHISNRKQNSHYNHNSLEEIMHDIDTIRMEYEAEGEGFNYEGDYEMETPLNEAEEEMLAAELLGATSEAEVDQFFGKLFQQVSKGLGSAAGKSLKKNGGGLGGLLKGIAKKVLPTVGKVLGTAIPIPGVGTAVGGMLGKAASNLLEAELEGLNYEDQEFQKAKNFVRLAGQAAKAGAHRPPTMNRHAAALSSVKDAMRRMHAQRIARWRARGGRRPRPGGFQAPPPFPDSGATRDVSAQDFGDLGSDGIDDSDLGADTDTQTASQEFEWEEENASPVAGARSGRWVRRGGKIVLLGV